MPKYTVYLMTPYVTWEGVKAKNEKDAIDKCDPPPELDLSEPWRMVAVKEER